MPTLEAGKLAFFDSCTGLVPCRVLRVYRTMRTAAVDIKITGTRGPYKRGEIVEFLQPSNVVPRDCVHTRNGQRYIRQYDIKFGA